MLLYPSIDELKTKVDSKYTLAILASKRARDIIDHKPVLAEADNEKPLSIATEEVYEDLVSYNRNAAEEACEEAPCEAEEAPAEEAEQTEAVVEE